MHSAIPNHKMAEQQDEQVNNREGEQVFSVTPIKLRFVGHSNN